MDAVPDWNTFPPAFQLVLREARNYQESRNVPTCCPEASAPTAEIKAVRKFLKNKELVVIGGDRREHARQALKEAFALKDVIWPGTDTHQSLDRLKPYIVRRSVKLVVLMIRWASHSAGDLKEFCDQHGKLFVRLPSGYSPNQVANQIVSQCGHLLSRTDR